MLRVLYTHCLNCFNSKDNKKTSVVLCLERWVESSKNVSMFSSQKCYFTVLVAGKLAVGIVKNCNVYKYTNPLRQIQVFQILPLFSLQTSTLPINSLPACRRLLFPLLHAEKGRLRNAVANRVPASCWVLKILGTRCDRLTHSAHCLT